MDDPNMNCETRDWAEREGGQRTQGSTRRWLRCEPLGAGATTARSASHARRRADGRLAAEAERNCPAGRASARCGRKRDCSPPAKFRARDQDQQSTFNCAGSRSSGCSPAGAFRAPAAMCPCASLSPIAVTPGSLVLARVFSLSLVFEQRLFDFTRAARRPLGL